MHLGRVAAAAALVCTVLVVGCASRHGPTGAPAPASTAARTRTVAPTPTLTPSPTPTQRPDQPRPVAPGAGARPQTSIKPKAHGRAFRAMVTDLWLAVSTGRAKLGRQAFFPVAAYKQVKAIVDPAADWKARLWDDFVLDVKAAHALLGHHANKAKLLKVLVANDAAAWIDPGVCYNRIGYWHVANSRVLYRLDGQVRSFGIASLISWRGVWYVVHFGGVVRPAVGMVDAPTTGPGYVGPQGGC